MLEYWYIPKNKQKIKKSWMTEIFQVNKIISHTNQRLIPKIAITTKVLEIQKTWMAYYENLARSCIYYFWIFLPVSFRWMLWRKIKQLASQLVDWFCLGKKTEIQIFTSSCWIFTIIQISFKISKAFTAVRNAPLKMISIQCAILSTVSHQEMWKEIVGYL